MSSVSVPFHQPSAGNTSDSSPLSPGVLPTAKQALSRVYSEDETKRATHTHSHHHNSRPPHHHPIRRHRHTHSLGLLSPTASSSSFTSLISDVQLRSSESSSNSFASSPASSQYHLVRKQTQDHESTSSQDTHSPAPSRSPLTHTRTRAPLSSSSSRLHTPPVRSPATPTPTSKAHTRASPSPLVQRLLQPFAFVGRASLPSSPTTTTTTLVPPLTTTSSPEPLLLPSSVMATLHHPAPQAHSHSAYQPPSPTNTTHPYHHSQSSSSSQRPPGRSEKLLRDALLRDEMERNGPIALAATGSSNPTSPPKVQAQVPAQGQGHKRRHSHVPSSSDTATTPSKSKEDYIRGSTLFRTAMSNPNPRSASPPLRGQVYYGGDAEGEGGVDAAAVALHHHQRHWDSQHQQHQQAPAHHQASTSQMQMPVHAHTPRRHEQQRSPAARSTSHSPSPLGRRNLQSPSQAQAQAQAQSGSTFPVSSKSPPGHHTVHASPSGSMSQQQQSPSGRQRSTTTGVAAPVGGGKTRPPPIDLFSSSGSSSSARQQQQQRPTHYRQSSGLTSASGPYGNDNEVGPGEPLMMTPHEQVLRARLERVLEQGRVVERIDRENERRKSAERGRSDGGSAAGSRSGSSRRGGAKANEVRDEEGGWPWRGAPITASVTATTHYSSPSTNSSGSGANSKPNPQYQPFVNAFTQLQPQPPLTPSGMHKRSRSKTDPVSPPPGPSAAVSSPRRNSTAPSPAHLGGTPSRKNSQQQRTGTTPPLIAEAELDGLGEEEDGELRLLTPPPTPPFTTRIFSFSTPQRQGQGQVHHHRAVTVGGAGGEYVPSPYKTGYSPTVPPHQRQQMKKDIPGLGMGVPPLSSRPRRAIQSSEEEHELEHDDASSSCSSNHHSHSQASFPSSNSSEVAIGPNSPTMNRLLSSPGSGAGASPSRPQFNARKASVQCRAMQGYVSFASVEGLGVPPAALGGDDALEGGEVVDGDGKKKEKGVLGVLGGWRKLLGVGGGGGVVESQSKEEGGGAGVVL
ncbi:hypothetical protein CPB84DRAFT_1843795 [Gymnopilus junonius]|uniref:Uncharacterized protein n=1 Tax=Gymnopilus junonius TaxID=109634 RepID=A0A9P5NWU9_GYMJU|nr:hypothetical protein CPB84DRAFT_1843795 [Gymnopilus junonius]